METDDGVIDVDDVTVEEVDINIDDANAEDDATQTSAYDDELIAAFNNITGQTADNITPQAVNPEEPFD